MPLFRKELAERIRPELGGHISTQLWQWLEDWMNRAGVPSDASEATAAPPPPAAPAAPAPTASTPAPPASSAAAGDDRYLALFQRLASPQADPETVKGMARAFAAHAPEYEQDKSKARIAEFVAQIANETGGFRVFEENLNYRAERILQIQGWPARVTKSAQARGVTVAEEAARLAHNPEALANVVYQRANEGNTQPGDGWRYRGRGALQLTFRNGYRRMGEIIKLPLEEHPEMAAEPAGSVLIALAFFKERKVNGPVDRGDFTEARRLTNGGTMGLAEVAALRAKALQALE